MQISHQTIMQLPSCFSATTLIILVVLALAGLSTHSMDEEGVTGSLYGLGGKLLVAMSKQNELPQNVIFSPISIQQALSMVLLGSDENSGTKLELLSMIEYLNMSQNEVEECHEKHARIMDNFARITNETMIKRQKFASDKTNESSGNNNNSSQLQPRSPVIDLLNMIVTKGKGRVKLEYEQNIDKYYRALDSSIDEEKPETRAELLKKLNDWAKEANFKGQIINEEYLRQHFEAILLSVIRVEAFWFDEFHEHESKKIFYNYGLNDKSVDGKLLKGISLNASHYLEFTTSERAKLKYLHELMSKDEVFNRLSNLNFHVVVIPLQGGLSFSIFEPLIDGNESHTAPNATKLIKLVEELSSSYDQNQTTTTTTSNKSMTKLEKALELLDGSGSQNDVDQLIMPKFEFESDIDLKPTLISLGLQRVFDGRCAEISNITSDRLYIAAIKHKAMIEATKTGMKASGVTMIKMVEYSAMMKSELIKVKFENPFLFVLRYQKIPLFVGQLTNLQT